MALIFTIDQVDGNSHIGVPVFSRSAKKHSYNYLVFTSPKHNENVQSNLNIFDQPDSNKKIGDDQQSQTRELLKKHGLAKYTNNDDKQKKLCQFISTNFCSGKKSDRSLICWRHTPSDIQGSSKRREFQKVVISKSQSKRLRQDISSYRKYDSQALTYGYEVQLFDTLIEQNSLEYNNLIAAKQGLNEINNHNNNVSGIKGYKNNLDICDNDQSYIQQHNQGSNNTGNITVKQSMLSSVTPNKLKKTSQQFPFLNSPITDPKHSHQRNNSDYKSNSLTKPGYYILHEYPELKIFKDEVKIAEQVVPRILTRNFLKTLRRMSFVSSRDPPHFK
eukprot:403369751